MLIVLAAGFDHPGARTLASCSPTHRFVQGASSLPTGPPSLTMLSALLRVGGIGDGLFVILFFVGISVLICCVGLRTDQPGAFFALAICLSLFIILFMVLVPKAPPGGYEDPAVYDHTSGFRKAAAGILGVSAFLTLVVVIGQVLVQPIQGSRIRNA